MTFRFMAVPNIAGYNDRAMRRAQSIYDAAEPPPSLLTDVQWEKLDELSTRANAIEFRDFRTFCHWLVEQLDVSADALELISEDRDVLTAWGRAHPGEAD